jgi:hypothetical protein
MDGMSRYIRIFVQNLAGAPECQPQARQTNDRRPSDNMTQNVTKRKNCLAAGFMIAKTFFLMLIIHRIGTRNLRDKKSLPENLVNYRAFLALRATYGRGSAHVFLGDGGAEGEPVDDGIGFPQRGQLEPGRSLVA